MTGWEANPAFGCASHPGWWSLDGERSATMADSPTVRTFAVQDNSSAGTTLTRYARFARTTLESGTFIPTMRSVGKRALSTSHSYGLKRDLAVPHETPVAKIPISVRAMRDDDVEHILDTHAEVDTAER